MKRYLATLFTLTSVLALGLGARAQDEDTVVAKIPHDFVVSGTLLPAGTYRISRVDSGLGIRELEISSYETGASALILPTVFSGTAGEHSQVSLQPVGDKYFLTKIQTPNGFYTIATPRSATELAQKDQHDRLSSSGTN
jgi:hypothetical protein